MQKIRKAYLEAERDEVGLVLGSTGSFFDAQGRGAENRDRKFMNDIIVGLKTIICRQSAIMGHKDGLYNRTLQVVNTSS